MKISIRKNKRVKVVVKPDPVNITSKEAKAEMRALIQRIEARRKDRSFEIPPCRNGRCPLCGKKRYLNVLIRQSGEPHLICMTCGLKPYREHRRALMKAGLHPSQGGKSVTIKIKRK